LLMVLDMSTMTVFFLMDIGSDHCPRNDEPIINDGYK
jgi:hypothetical protein